MTARLDALRAQIRTLDLGAVDLCADDLSAMLAELARTWWALLEMLAKRDPVAAGRLARVQWDQLSGFRPEAPAPLDDGFTPTEAVPTAAPGGDAP